MSEPPDELRPRDEPPSRRAQIARDPARDWMPLEERHHADHMQRLDRIAEALEAIAERLSYNRLPEVTATTRPAA